MIRKSVHHACPCQGKCDAVRFSGAESNPRFGRFASHFYPQFLTQKLELISTSAPAPIREWSPFIPAIRRPSVNRRKCPSVHSRNQKIRHYKCSLVWPTKARALCLGSCQTIAQPPRPGPTLRRGAYRLALPTPRKLTIQPAFAGQGGRLLLHRPTDAASRTTESPLPDPRIIARTGLGHVIRRRPEYRPCEVPRR